MDRKKPIPDDCSAVTPEEMYEILSGGKTIKDYLAGWNMRLGAAATENKRIVDDLIDDKLANMQRTLKSGGTAVDIKLQTHYLMRNSRLGALQNQAALEAYISLYMFNKLEEFRAANRSKFIYLVKDKAKK